MAGHAWSFAPQLTVPLFSGGRLRFGAGSLPEGKLMPSRERAIQTAFSGRLMAWLDVRPTPADRGADPCGER